MFEIFEDTICVHGGWLYNKTGANIIKKYQYDNYVRFGPFRVMRKGGGKNTPALIAWCSLHPDFQETIIEKFGNPEDTTKHIIFTEFLEKDTTAEKFYKNYTLDNGSAIADDLIKLHTAEASIFNTIQRILNNRILKTKALGSGGLTTAWKKIAVIVHELPRHTWAHRLPKNYRSLQRKYKSYTAGSYEALLHGGHGHKNSEKINDLAKQWTLARWCDRVYKVATLAQMLDEYNEKAVQESWKTLKDEKTIYNYLYAPEVKSQWYGYRYGELKAKEKYTPQHSTKMPTLRDSLWYSDGTKLNLYYRDENGKMATCQVYEVMDAFSEVLLGYHISKTEDYQAQYFAYKMAVKTSGHRPYEIRFDGQGGHKKLVSGNFLSKLSHLAIRTQPYNGKSKTIESAFGRFQQQILKKDTFYTGQNITAKKAESKVNMEWVLANTHKLPTLDQAKQNYLDYRTEWNNAAHYKTGMPRLEMYHNSTNAKAPEIDMLDMVDIFWIEREKQVTCTAFGITFTEKKEKYTFMVYNENRMPDMDFLNNNVDRKFTIKYDPEDMTLIYLYERTPNGLTRVAAAETKIQTARNIQEQEAWEASYLKKVNEKSKTNRVEKRNNIDALLEQFGMLPEQNGFVSPHLKGVENRKKPTQKVKQITIGEHQKEVSNMDYTSHRDEY